MKGSPHSVEYQHRERCPLLYDALLRFVQSSASLSVIFSMVSCDIKDGMPTTTRLGVPESLRSCDCGAHHLFQQDNLQQIDALV